MRWWPAAGRLLRDHVRSASWPFVVGTVAAAFVAGNVALFTLISWLDDPRTELRTHARIRPCAAATVAFVPTQYRDRTTFDLAADERRCAPALTRSIVEASRGECAGFLEHNGACHYMAGQRSVFVYRQRPRPDWSARYTIDTD